jgi:hypothetical protein
MNVRRWLVAVCCLPLLGLAGCSDDPSQAQPQDPPSSSATAKPSPSETGPTIPPEAQGTDEASAKAFVKHWFEVFSSAMVSGETADLKSLSASSCQSCSAFVEVIDRTYSRGGRIESSGWTAVQFTRLDFEAMAFDFVARTGQERFLEADGSVARRAAAGSQDMTVRLVLDDYTWRIARLAVLDG